MYRHYHNNTFQHHIFILLNLKLTIQYLEPWHELNTNLANWLWVCSASTVGLRHTAEVYFSTTLLEPKILFKYTTELIFPWTKSYLNSRTQFKYKLNIKTVFLSWLWTNKPSWTNSIYYLTDMDWSCIDMNNN